MVGHQAVECFAQAGADGRDFAQFLGRQVIEILVHRVAGVDLVLDAVRSEEHTSELQSLMRISYAVFCLKKKNHTQQLTRTPSKHTSQNTKHHYDRPDNHTKTHI